MHDIAIPMPEQVRSVIRDHIVENFLFGEAGGLTDEASLLEAGALDSTGIIELVGFLEETYGIAIRDQDLVPGNFESIERIAGFVSARLREGVQAARG